MSSLASIPKLSASQQQRPLTTLKPDIFLIFLAFTALTPAVLPTATEPRKDNKNNLALVQTILDELLAGNIDSGGSMPRIQKPNPAGWHSQALALFCRL